MSSSPEAKLATRGTFLRFIGAAVTEEELFDDAVQQYLGSITNIHLAASIAEGETRLAAHHPNRHPEICPFPNTNEPNIAQLVVATYGYVMGLVPFSVYAGDITTSEISRLGKVDGEMVLVRIVWGCAALWYGIVTGAALYAYEGNREAAIRDIDLQGRYLLSQLPEFRPYLAN